ncbi:MAG: MFS transporter [Limisphaerales bacterium]
MQAPQDSKESQRTRPDVSPAPNAGDSITVYHWLVVILATCGWFFDCMGQRIFVISREPALRELLGATVSDDTVRRWGGLATSMMMVGWATGGILFGLMSDRWGRVRAMVSTLLAYTVFSGVAGFARTGTEFLVYRFLFGLGVGGMFGSATTLVAESVPQRARTLALGLMQSLSAGGTMLGSALSLGITPGRENFWGHFSGWQVLCFAGVCPAVLAVPMGLLLKEPEPWKKAKALAAAEGRAKSVGSMADLFTHPRWRRGMLVGVCLGVAGMVGLWGIAFFSPELITTALKNRPLQTVEIVKPAEVCAALITATNPAIARLKGDLSPEAIGQLQALRGAAEISAGAIEVLRSELDRVIQGGPIYEARAFQSVPLKKATQNLVKLVEKNGGRENQVFLNRQLVEQLFPGDIVELQKTIDQMRSKGTMLQDVGAVVGMLAFTFAASYLNRRTAFLGAFLFCLGAVAFVFHSLRSAADICWMLPLMGFGTLSVFAGYSIYFPELFPTRLRGTGVGLCYNTVRYLTAPFPFLLGWLSTLLPFRTVAVMMCSIYLLGIVALAWAPETKGQPLPED